MDYSITTNIEVELHALRRGLEIAIREKYQKLLIEGDAKLVIDIVKHLQNGTLAEKMRRSWRMAWLVEETC